MRREGRGGGKGGGVVWGGVGVVARVGDDLSLQVCGDILCGVVQLGSCGLTECIAECCM